MEASGKGMTERDLRDLPEAKNVVLWQPDNDAPTSVVDSEGVGWMIGFYQERLCKRRMR